ncbi:hypothetical protein DER44DRAFT_265042 [Fusarium oxysporum]|nr:hypothetical protein DER44DRAFT_265042 [Fusarium oxysporum]
MLNQQLILLSIIVCGQAYICQDLSLNRRHKVQTKGQFPHITTRLQRHLESQAFKNSLFSSETSFFCKTKKKYMS